MNDSSVSRLHGVSSFQRPQVIPFTDCSCPPKNLQSREKTGALIVCDESHEWLLPWWFENFRIHNSLPVCVIDIGLSSRARRNCRTDSDVDLITVSDLPSFDKAWYLKPFAMRLSPFPRTLYIDMDCEVRCSVTPLFQTPRDYLLIAKDKYLMFEVRALFEPDCYFNSGVIGYSNSRAITSLLDAWCDLIIQQHKRFRGDQEILNLLLYTQLNTVVELPGKYNRLRLDGDCEDTAIMHWTGPKGKEEIKRQILL